MSKHSPGPWRLDEFAGYVSARDAQGREIIETHGMCDAALKIPSAADARLIAAAPELLEALEDFTANCECQMHTSQSERVERLIKRVRGE